MKRKKAAIYIAVIVSLISLSLVTPLVINMVADAIAEKIREAEAGAEDESEGAPHEEVAASGPGSASSGQRDHYGEIPAAGQGTGSGQGADSGQGTDNGSSSAANNGEEDGDEYASLSVEAESDGYVSQLLPGAGHGNAAAAISQDGSQSVLAGQTHDDQSVGSEENTLNGFEEKPGTGSGKKKESGSETTIVDALYYDEPIYHSQEEEDAANRQTYQDMTEKLLSLSEAAEEYRRNFNPVYDELKAGLMNAFISGREQIFYEDIADYCFGHYNTTRQISMVRFDAVTEDTPEKMTVILEFMTAEDMLSDTTVPDLTYCTYNKKTEAFLFFTGTK